MNRKPKMIQDQIIALWQIGYPARKIAEVLDIHRDTVRGYLKAFGLSLKRGRPKSAVLGRKPPPDLKSKPAIFLSKLPPTSRSLCEDYRGYIEERLGRGMLAKSIWQDLVEEERFSGSYDSVKCFVRKIRKRLPEVFAVIPTEPGLEAQVDYGRGAPTKCPFSGKYKRPWLFSMKLSHSRRAFRKVVWKSSSEI